MTASRSENTKLYSFILSHAGRMPLLMTLNSRRTFERESDLCQNLHDSGPRPTCARVAYSRSICLRTIRATTYAKRSYLRFVDILRCRVAAKIKEFAPINHPAGARFSLRHGRTALDLYRVRLCLPF